MKREQVYYVVSTEIGAGLTSVSIGLVRALDREGMRVAFYKPVHQPETKSSSGDVHSVGSESDSEDDFEDVQER